MSDILLNLKNLELFLDNELKIDKKVCFIFGKNGTGKSTLTSLFKEQISNYDVNIFNGFDGVVGENKKLNAIVLGQKNNEVDLNIRECKLEIKNIEDNILKLKEETEENEENKNNLWAKSKRAEKDYKDKDKEITNFYSDSAKKIKYMTEPQIATPKYDRENFKLEIKKSNFLSEKDINKNIEIIKLDLKEAIKLNLIIEINFSEILEKTNFLLLKKVEEKEQITEISENSEKSEFAKLGLKLHKSNDTCAFCGNNISEKRYLKLERYFSATEVKEFELEISNHTTFLNNKISEITNFIINERDFYPEYIEEISKIKNLIEDKKETIITFLENLKKALEKKLKNLFNSSDTIKINEIPKDFNNEISTFNELVDKNNKNNLFSMKNEARNLLRYNEINKLLISFNYNKHDNELTQLKGKMESFKVLLENKKDDIEKFNKEIDKIQDKIKKLEYQTKNEKILAQEINSKLELYVNFSLEHLEENESKGYYCVRSKHTNKLRNVTELSTGEKNIIAFLYFIQKLRDINNPNDNLPKLIIFDDPMSSNDDTMQYLIIEELNNLIKYGVKDEDKIIILTHNSHFYLNVKYNYNSNKNIFIRLESNGKNTIIKKLEYKDDFKTNYEALWLELIFIYNNSPSASMLLNLIRRIIETFAKFNCINKSNMLSHVVGAEKLFNVNSHSIDDLEAELNGKDKQDILKMMKKCFEEEGAKDHFNMYFKIKLN